MAWKIRSNMLPYRGMRRTGARRLPETGTRRSSPHLPAAASFTPFPGRMRQASGVSGTDAHVFPEVPARIRPEVLRDEIPEPFDGHLRGIVSFGVLKQFFMLREALPRESDCLTRLEREYALKVSEEAPDPILRKPYGKTRKLLMRAVSVRCPPGKVSGLCQSQARRVLRAEYDEERKREEKTE